MTMSAISGVAIGMYLPTPLSLGAWFTAAILFLFAFVGRNAAHYEPNSEARSETPQNGLGPDTFVPPRSGTWRIRNVKS